MKVICRSRDFRAAISEPLQGQVLDNGGGCVVSDTRCGFLPLQNPLWRQLSSEQQYSVVYVCSLFTLYWLE